MDIGILGTGGMASALGAAWTSAGHSVMIGGRSASRAAAVAARIGAAGHGTLAEAAGSGEAVLLAVPAAAGTDLARDLAGALAGRTLVDCTNAIVPGPLLDPSHGAAALARAAPDTRVVKAFNLCRVSIWTLRPPTFEGVPLAVPYCTDDPAAGAVAAALIGSLGCVASPAGGLARAAYLEAAAALAISLWHTGHEPRAAFPSPAEAPPPP